VQKKEKCGFDSAFFPKRRYVPAAYFIWKKISFFAARSQDQRV
jgi:hypothetical protein